MSRSTRQPATTFVCYSPAGVRWWKRAYNRRIRRKANQLIQATHWSRIDDQHFPDKTTEANPWDGPRDGTQSVLHEAADDPQWIRRLITRLRRK